jgi:hypothetical protein
MNRLVIASAVVLGSIAGAAAAQSSPSSTAAEPTTTEAATSVTPADANGATVTRESVTTGAGEVSSTQTVETPSGNSIEVTKETADDGDQTTTVTKTDKPTRSKKPK